MTELPGTGASLWTATAPAPPRPPLQAATDADVCVVGAGFTGLTAALALARAGARLVVLDSHEVCAGVSGHTTAKITSLHCPCHGSRFDPGGAVLQGPATRPLERRPVSARTSG